MVYDILEWMINQNSRVILSFLVGNFFGGWLIYTFLLPRLVCRATEKLSRQVNQLESELHALTEELQPYRELAAQQVKKVLANDSHP